MACISLFLTRNIHSNILSLCLSPNPWWSVLVCSGYSQHFPLHSSVCSYKLFPSSFIKAPSFWCVWWDCQDALIVHLSSQGDRPGHLYYCVHEIAPLHSYSFWFIFHRLSLNYLCEKRYDNFSTPKSFVPDHYLFSSQLIHFTLPLFTSHSPSILISYFLCKSWIMMCMLSS